MATHRTCDICKKPLSAAELVTLHYNGGGACHEVTGGSFLMPRKLDLHTECFDTLQEQCGKIIRAGMAG